MQNLLRLSYEKILLLRAVIFRDDYRIWQRRFWEHLIQNEHDYRTHIDYVHINPFKHQYVTQVRDWPYSSFHSWVEKGVYTIDWATLTEP